MTFLLVVTVTNIIGSSSKILDMLRDQQMDEISITLEEGELVIEMVHI